MFCASSHSKSSPAMWSVREQNTFTKCSFSIRSSFLPFFLWVDGWIGAAIFHIQIRILFHFPVCVFFCTFLDHFVCFRFYFLFIWFCNYFWRPTLRMWKKKNAYALHKFHLVCNAHIYVHTTRARALFLRVTVAVIHKMCKLRWNSLQLATRRSKRMRLL